MAQSYVASIVCLAWVSNSISDSSSKRAVALAFVNTAGTFGFIGAP